MAQEWEIDALVGILMDPTNVDKTVEELAGELIDSLDRVRAHTPRDQLAVLLRYTLDQGITQHYAALGPYPPEERERAVRDAQGIAGRPSRPGQGRFMVVPLYVSTQQAWAAVDPPTVRAPQPPLPPGFTPEGQRRPSCRCGLRPSGPRDSGVCPRHPERNT